MEIAIIGCGYVGLTTGLALAELGNNCILVDAVPAKLEAIEGGRSPFYEPGVDDLIAKHLKSGRIRTSRDTREAVNASEVVFITVGTPSKRDGGMDGRFIKKASKDIGAALIGAEDFKVVVMKSTVVPGTTAGLLKATLEKASGLSAGRDFGLAMCPEFLREGSAMFDSMHPDRIVIGAVDDRSFETINSLFGPLGSRVLRTDPTTAEMIKYTSNSFLATKISFANEISRLCEKLKIDVYDVMEGVGMDSRISPKFLRAGVGYGGSCFPKDVSALVHLAGELGEGTPVMDGVMRTNDIQPRHLVDAIGEILGTLKGKRIAVLGLAFKPDTDDVRETRAFPVVSLLMKKGAVVRAHDPKAVENFRRLVPKLRYFDSPSEALDWAEAVVILTEWPEYRNLQWEGRKRLRWVFDGRRSLDPSKVKGVRYWALGSPLPENL